MNDPIESSLTRDLRENFGSEYPFVDLWRDRRRILAEPSSALQRGALRTPPVRFALALGVAPLLVAGWLMAQLASLLVVDPAPAAAESSALFAEALREPLRDVDTAQLREQRDAYRELPPPLRDLVRTGSASIDRLPEQEARPAAQAAARRWLAELDLAAATAAQKRTAHARLLYEADGKAKLDALRRDMFDSFLQGGLLADIGFAISILLGAHMFRRFIRRDPRFVHAAHADRFYLYYVTSRMFWWTVALIPVYGAVAFEHAGGLSGLGGHLDTAQGVLSTGSMVYLLLYCGAFARALNGTADADFATKFSVGWRLVASMMVSFVLTMVLVALVVAVPLIAYALWLLR